MDLLFPGEDVSAPKGYPVCEATVEYPVKGDAALVLLQAKSFEGAQEDSLSLLPRRTAEKSRRLDFTTDLSSR